MNPISDIAVDFSQQTEFLGFYRFSLTVLAKAAFFLFTPVDFSERQYGKVKLELYMWVYDSFWRGQVEALGCIHSRSIYH